MGFLQISTAVLVLFVAMEEGPLDSNVFGDLSGESRGIFLCFVLFFFVVVLVLVVCCGLLAGSLISAVGFGDAC